MTKSTQPVFFISNHERQEKFRVETRIYKEGNTFYAEKRAVSDQSWQHLQKMLITYKTLSDVKGFGKYAKIIAPKKGLSHSLEFDFIEGATAERLLLETITQKDATAANAIIEKVMSIIESLPTVTTNRENTAQFETVFGNVFSDEKEWTSASVVDLNLDNFIVDSSGNWHLFDYEWVFDFAIPKKLLTLRFLWYFFSRHKEILHYHAQSIPSVKVGKQIYLPRFIYDKYETIFTELHKAKLTESWIQAYATGKNEQKLSSESVSKFEITDADIFVDGITLFSKKVSRKATVTTRKQFKKAQHDLEVSTEDRAHLRRELEAVRGSKAYKLVRKASSIKNKLSKGRR